MDYIIIIINDIVCSRVITLLPFWLKRGRFRVDLRTGGSEVGSESGCTILDSVSGVELLETVSGFSVDKSGVSSHSKFPAVVSELSLTSA